jgi:hypothetical protein
MQQTKSIKEMSFVWYLQRYFIIVIPLCKLDIQDFKVVPLQDILISLNGTDLKEMSLQFPSGATTSRGSHMPLT